MLRVRNSLSRIMKSEVRLTVRIRLNCVVSRMLWAYLLFPVGISASLAARFGPQVGEFFLDAGLETQGQMTVLRLERSRLVTTAVGCRHLQFTSIILNIGSTHFASFSSPRKLSRLRSLLSGDRDYLCRRRSCHRRICVGRIQSARTVAENSVLQWQYSVRLCCGLFVSTSVRPV